MILDNNIEINNDAIIESLKKLTNQIYKLLPNREEGIDWEMPLQTIIEEISGMDKLLSKYHSILFPILCKLHGLFEFKEDKDFHLYRRTIFECLNLLSSIKEDIVSCQD